MARPRTVDHPTAVALLLEGHSHRAVARMLGVSASSIDQIAALYTGDYPALRPKIVRIMPRFVRVPDEYRAAGLAEDYRDLARDFGDVEGERRCRRLLDEMHRQEAIAARLERAA